MELLDLGNQRLVNEYLTSEQISSKFVLFIIRLVHLDLKGAPPKVSYLKEVVKCKILITQ